MLRRFVPYAALFLAALLTLCGCGVSAPQNAFRPQEETFSPSPAATAAPSPSPSPSPTPSPTPSPSPSPTPTPGPPENYTLAFADEFSTDGAPDETIWGYDLGAWPYNRELEYYTRENAWIEDGVLVIEARAEDAGNRAYTSARLKTEGKFDFTYGYLEVRAALPTGVGTWSAIWMLPTDKQYGGYLQSGEIDIAERVGYDAKKIYTTIHTFANNSVQDNAIDGSVRVGRRDEAYHIYGILWEEDAILISFDGQEILRYLRPENSDSTTWPFDVPFHLILNIAVGGSWGGIKGVDDEAFPQYMYVDYVRYYQPAAESSAID